MTRSIRNDDWANSQSGLGIRDKTAAVAFLARPRLSQKQLEALYEQSSIVARAVDKVVDDALREGWSLTGLPPDIDFKRDIAPKLDKLGFDKTLARACKWSRLYGGGGMSIPVIDGSPPSRPIGERPRGPGEASPMLTTPVPFTAYELVPAEADGNFNSPTFRQVLTYDVTVAGAGTIKVDRSRLLTFEPISLPYDALQNSPTRWGPSIVERMFDALSKYGSAQSHAVAMMYIGSVLFIKWKDFKKTHKTAGGKDQLRDLATLVQQTLSSTGLLTLDSEDDIGNLTLTIAGAHDLILDMRNAVAESQDMPREILFNESPAGTLNGPGELSGPQELWNAKVGVFRKEVLTPAIMKFLAVALPIWGMSCEGYEVDWPGLREKSDTESSTTAAQNANADNLYFQMGAVTADEVREHRFIQGRQDPIEIAAEADEPLALDLSAPDVAAYQAAEAPTDDKVADQALNGAQIASLVEIVEKAQAGLLPRDAAAAIIAAAFPSIGARAEQILGSAGAGATAPVVAAPTDEAAGQSKDPMPSDLMSPRDAGQRFGVSTRSITRQIELGRLRYWGIGAHKRVSLAEVAELAKSHEQSSEPEELDDPALAEEPDGAAA